MNRLATIGRTTVTVAQVACFVHLVDEWFGGANFCLGESMLPTFNRTGDYVFQSRRAIKQRDLHVGMIVTSLSPTDPEHSLMKRIMALEGDIICVDPVVPNSKYVQIPKGHVWLAGDNAANSIDSRTFGPVPIRLLRGHVTHRLFPNFTKFDSEVYNL